MGSALSGPARTPEPDAHGECAGSLLPERVDLIEIHWGEPLSFVMSPEGDVQKFSTIEQARFWLSRKWPVSDDARERALHHLDAAMDCLGSVGTARRAFIAAARSAGFVPEDLIALSRRQAA